MAVNLNLNRLEEWWKFEDDLEKAKGLGRSGYLEYTIITTSYPENYDPEFINVLKKIFKTFQDLKSLNVFNLKLDPKALLYSTKLKYWVYIYFQEENCGVNIICKVNNTTVLHLNIYKTSDTGKPIIQILKYQNGNLVYTNVDVRDINIDFQNFKKEVNLGLKKDKSLKENIKKINDQIEKAVGQILPSTVRDIISKFVHE